MMRLPVPVLLIAALLPCAAAAQDDAPPVEAAPRADRPPSERLPEIPELETDWQSLFGELTDDETDAAPQTGAPLSYTVDDSSLADLPFRARFRDLSLLFQGADGDVPSRAELNRRLRVDSETLVRLLRANGYYDPLIEPEVRTDANAPNRLSVQLNVDPGPLYRFGSIDAPRLSLQPGAPVEAAEVNRQLTELQLALPREGYPFAEVPEPDITIDHGTREASLTLPVRTGPRARFGDIRVTGDDAPFSAKHVSRLARFGTGDVYDEAEIDDLRQALIATGLVGSVGIQTVEGEELTGGEVAADVVIDIESAPPRTIAALVAFDTEDGLRLEGSWQHRNLIRPEGAVTATGILGNREQALGLNLRRSNYKKRDRTVGGGVLFTLEDRDAFYRRAVEVNAYLERETNLIWQKRWTYRIGPEFIFSQERDRSAIAGRRAPIRDYVIGAFPGRLGYDGSDDLLNPSSGFRLNGLLSPEVSLQGGAFTYARTEVEGSVYLPFGEANKFVLAGRGLVGSIVGADRENIAPSRRLYAGGGGSVRGFGYQDLGPRDLDRDPLGGRSKVEASVEARYRFGDLGAVAFADAGQVYAGSDPTFQDLRVGVGIGARYFTSFGPIRVDIATPLDRRKGESIVAIYVSIGQAF